MSCLSKFDRSIKEKLLRDFDQSVTAQGYANCPKALCDLMRDALVKSWLETSSQKSEVLGNLTFVCNHHARESNRMKELRRDHHNLVVSALHVHISHDDCMKVIVLRGGLREIRELTD